MDGTERDMKPFIWVEGLIGAGKSTLVPKLSAALGCQAFLEPGVENPWLTEFYANPNKYGQLMQDWCLETRIAQHLEALRAPDGAVLDRGLIGDRVFAKIMADKGYISQPHWADYCRRSDEAMLLLQTRPRLVLYLNAGVPLAMQRVGERNRAGEVVSSAYQQTLEDAYKTYLGVIMERRRSWMDHTQVWRVSVDATDNLTPLVLRLKDYFGAACNE
jgi:deoxyadenosine kinase